MRTIVLAWIDKRSWRSEFQRPQAALWASRGTAGDLARAREHARQYHYQVFVFPTTEKHPLERARAGMVLLAQAGVPV
jgi:hypothetical protein